MDDSKAELLKIDQEIQTKRDEIDKLKKEERAEKASVEAAKKFAFENANKNARISEANTQKAKA